MEVESESANNSAVLFRRKAVSPMAGLSLRGFLVAFICFLLLLFLGRFCVAAVLVGLILLFPKEEDDDDDDDDDSAVNGSITAISL